MIKVKERLNIPDHERFNVTAPLKAKGVPFNKSNITTMAKYSYSGATVSQPTFRLTVIEVMKEAQTLFTYK